MKLDIVKFTSVKYINFNELYINCESFNYAGINLMLIYKR